MEAIYTKLVVEFIDQLNKPNKVQFFSNQLCINLYLGIGGTITHVHLPSIQIHFGGNNKTYLSIFSEYGTWSGGSSLQDIVQYCTLLKESTSDLSSWYGKVQNGQKLTTMESSTQDKDLVCWRVHFLGHLFSQFRWIQRPPPWVGGNQGTPMNSKPFFCDDNHQCCGKDSGNQGWRDRKCVCFSAASLVMPTH